MRQRDIFRKYLHARNKICFSFVFHFVVFHLLRTAKSKIVRMREYGTSCSIRVELSSRSSRDILREGRKERSWRTEKMPRKFWEKEEKKSREGGARKNGSTVEAFACKALSESCSDGVVVPRLLNLFEIRVSWSIKPPFNQPPARLKVSSLPTTTWCALRARTPVHVDPFYDDSTDVSKTNLPLSDFSSFTSQNNLWKLYRLLFYHLSVGHFSICFFVQHFIV